MNKTKKNEIIIGCYKIKNVTYPKLAIFLSILLVLLISLMFSNYFNVLINGEYYIISKDGKQINEQGLFVHYINVGQGDATFIELPDGKNMLIDCGTYSSKNLIKYLKNTKCNGKIDYFVLTHNHNDHYGQINNIINNFEIDTIFRPNVYATQIEQVNPDILYYGEDNSNAFKSVVECINRAKDRGCKIIVSNNNIKIENNKHNYYIDFIVCDDNPKDCNDFSPIILLNYNGYKYVFSGDATASIEEYATNYYATQIENCYVLKVGHHGSNTSSSESYLKVLNSEYAIISVLEGSYQAVPSSDVLFRLKESGIDDNNIFRTDIDGTIVSVTTNEDECLLYPINKLKTANNTIYIQWYYIVIVIFTISTMLIFNRKIVVINLIK